MIRSLAFFALSASYGYARADVCSDTFYLNPQETDRETFLDQFKPCGFYAANCAHKFGDWFDEYGGFVPGDEDTLLLPNVCYPGRPQNSFDELQSGVNLVQFDIGLDRTAYDAALGLAGEPDEYTLIDDASGVEFDYLTFPKNPDGSWTVKRGLEFGETCIETFAKSRDNWGQPTYGGKYGCMGGCGSGCARVGIAKDCMKHDVCSYFKTVATEKEAVGFCTDFDCGDEAAQTVTNCKQGSFSGQQVTCREDSVVEINPAARALSNKRACILRTKWERNQGMPWLRRPDGAKCGDYNDCQSRRCDFRFGVRVCMPRKPNGQRCNEDSDCTSVFCTRGRCRSRGFLEVGQRCNEDADCHSFSCDGTCLEEDEESTLVNLRGHKNANEIELE